LPAIAAKLDSYGGVLYFTGSTSNALIDPIAKRLKKGLKVQVVNRFYTFAEDDPTRPRVLLVRACQVAYSLWDEVFEVARYDSAPVPKVRTIVNMKGVLRACFEFDRLEVAQHADLKLGAAHFVAVVTEVNLGDARFRELVARVTRSGVALRVHDPLREEFGALMCDAPVHPVESILRFRSDNLVL